MEGPWTSYYYRYSFARSDLLYSLSSEAIKCVQDVMQNQSTNNSAEVILVDLWVEGKNK